MKTLKQIKKGITGRSAFVPSLLRFFVFSALSLCASVPLFVSPARAEVPVKFNYQGNLRQAGFLVNGQRTMVFRIYDSSAPSATEIWASPTYSVSVSTGVFRVTLEPGLTDWQSGDMWLELEVEGNRMSPREELTSSPFSINTRMISGKRYETAAVAPVATAVGDLWYNTLSNGLNIWDGTGWVSATGSGSSSPHAATHSGTGTDPILSLGGHTVTGNLVLTGTLNPFSNLNVGGGGYSVTFASSVTAGWYRGNGSGLTNLNASRITSGLLSGDRIGNVIVSTHIVDGSILGQDLADGSVTRAKLNQSGCAEGDILKMVGTQWTCSSGSGAGPETDPLSIHNQAVLQAGATFYVSSGTANYFNVNNTLKAADAVINGTLNPSSSLNIGGAGYGVTFASAVTAGWFYGDGSNLTGVSGSDNLGNHTATTTLNMAGFPVTNAGAVTAASFLATGIGIDAARLGLAANVAISSEASSALGAGVRISSNVYIVGFSSAAKYYGDGSGLTGVQGSDNLGNHIATTTLNMAGFPVTNAGAVTAASFLATGIGIDAARLGLAANVSISSEASAALGAGVRISSNVYIVGFSSAARYYGDGSGLTGISGADNLGNHTATTNLNMAGFNIAGVSTLTVSTVTTAAAGVNFSTHVFVAGNVGIGTQTPEAKLAVTSPGNAGEYIAVFHSGSKLAAWLRNK